MRCLLPWSVAEYLRRSGGQCSETFALEGRVRGVLSAGLDRRPLLDPRFTWTPTHRVGLRAWGSNQHGQLGLPVEGQEGGIAEAAIPVGGHVDASMAEGWGSGKALAGGGHSGLLLPDGRLFLWGWNAHGQTWDWDGGVLRQFPRRVAAAALGHSHTLVLEKGTGRVFGLGSDGRGEATGGAGGGDCREEGGGAVVVLEGEAAVYCAAGVQHSAAVTLEGKSVHGSDKHPTSTDFALKAGDLVTWGSGKHGQCLPAERPRWKPQDGALVTKVGADLLVFTSKISNVHTLAAKSHVMFRLSAPFLNFALCTLFDCTRFGADRGIRWHRTTVVVPGLLASTSTANSAGSALRSVGQRRWSSPPDCESRAWPAAGPMWWPW
jgi:hypothetical protein